MKNNPFVEAGKKGAQAKKDKHSKKKYAELQSKAGKLGVQAMKKAIIDDYIATHTGGDIDKQANSNL